MKFHKYPQEEPEGNLYNKNNFLCKVLYSVKDEKERQYTSANYTVFVIGKTDIGIPTLLIEKEMTTVFLLNVKSSDGLKSSRRLTKTVVRFVVCKF